MRIWSYSHGICAIKMLIIIIIIIKDNDKTINILILMHVAIVSQNSPSRLNWNIIACDATNNVHEKLLDSNLLRAVQFKCTTSDKSDQCKLLIVILDYDWLKDNRKFSNKMASCKIITNILCWNLPWLPLSQGLYSLLANFATQTAFLFFYWYEAFFSVSAWRFDQRFTSQISK